MKSQFKMADQSMKKVKLELSKNEVSDRFSELPEHMIHHILSFVPLKDVGRTCILSKTWKNLCSSYNIVSYLYYDHNSFALQSLLDKADAKTDEITNRFMDYADNHLLGLIQQQSRVFKLTIDVAVTDSEFARVDQLMELVGKAKVEELIIFVQTQDFRDWYEEEEDWLKENYIFYEFPYALIWGSKWLQSLTVKWCKFTQLLSSLPSNNNNAGMFSSLRQLWLSQVLLVGEESINNLASCCSGIELIEFDCCCFSTATLKLSKFPKLKRAYLINDQYGLQYVDITETNLETFHCSSLDTLCLVSLAACSTISELELCQSSVNHPDLLNNLATYFPLLEDAKLWDVTVMPMEDSLDRFTAANLHLRTLELTFDGSIKVVMINCPNLEYFKCTGARFEELYMNCPALRSLHYWSTSRVPRLILSDLPTDMKNVYLSFYVDCVLCTSWFIDLRKYLLQIRGCNNVHLHLQISPNMGKFVLDEFRAAQTFNLDNNVHLQVDIYHYGGKHNSVSAATVIDGLLWSIQPATLSVSGYHHYGFVKYLCDKLLQEPRDKSCCDDQLCSKYWWHNIIDFQVEYKNEDVKWRLGSLVEMCKARPFECLPIRFKFQWYSVDSFVAKLLVEMKGSRIQPQLF